MAVKRSYYELLEVQVQATPDEVKAAYRKLARKYHPDVNPGDHSAESRFKDIGEAYAVLSDPDKRRAYDLLMGFYRAKSTKATSQAKSATGSGASKSNPASPSSRPQNSSGMKDKPKEKTRYRTKAQEDSPYVDVSGTKFKEMFDSLFRRPEKETEAKAESKSEPKRETKTEPKTEAKTEDKGKKPVRGEDVTVEAVISEAEAREGVVKKVNVEHKEICRRCSATGRVNGLVCSACNGEKVQVTLRKIDVKIPPNVKDGSKVRVSREGGRGLAGGEPGDLFLMIHIEPDTPLRVEGPNVYCEMDITLYQAVLGCELEVQTLHGKVKMVIPELTDSGKVFRLKGQGAKSGNAIGDQFVTVRIVVPKKLTKKEKALFQSLADLHNHPEA